MPLSLVRCFGRHPNGRHPQKLRVKAKRCIRAEAQKEQKEKKKIRVASLVPGGKIPRSKNDIAFSLHEVGYLFRREVLMHKQEANFLDW